MLETSYKSKKDIRVLLLTPWFPAHSEDYRGSYIWDSISALSSQGVTIDVLLIQSWKFRKYQIKESEFPVTIIRLRCISIPRHYFRYISNIIYKYSVFFKLKKMIRIKKYDMIHGHTEMTSIPIAKISRKYNIPSVVTIHGIETCQRFWAGKAGAMVYSSLNNMNKIVMVGDPLVRSFKPYITDKKKISVVHNGFRFDKKFIELEGRKQWGDVLNMISVSNLQVSKGVDINIKALAALEKKGYTKWRYLIIGDGSERTCLEQLVKENNLQHKIIFKGTKPHDEVYRYMQAADIFSLPSSPEAFGIVYLEAMANGLLTIAIKGQGASVFIDHGKSGLLLENTELSTLVITFKFIFDNKTQARMIANNSSEYVINNHTWDKHALQLMQVYDELI